MFTTVTTGEMIRIKGQGSWGRAGAPCESKTNGHWFCVTHGVALHDEFAKSDHLDEYGKPNVRHRMVWWCHEHGPEQP